MSRQKGDIMREVLISIQPRWVEKIVSGKKTVEVRKNKPKLETPFKVYIYETQGRTETPWVDEDGHEIFKGRGQVIGEFVCDKIVQFENSWFDEALPETVARSCVPMHDFIVYLGAKDYGYGWHITDLVVYDETRELSEFRTPDWYADCEKCNYLEKMRCPVKDSHKADIMATACRRVGKPITRPPMSWQFCVATEPRQTAD